MTAVLGAQVEDAPETQYGSPANLNGAVVWTPAAFLWQNPAIPVGTNVQWRIKLCDLSGNCASTANMTFSIVSSNTPPVAVGDTYNTDAGVALTITAPGVLSNDTDADFDLLTAIEVQIRHTACSVSIQMVRSFTHQTPDIQVLTHSPIGPTMVLQIAISQPSRFR